MTGFDYKLAVAYANRCFVGKGHRRRTGIPQGETQMSENARIVRDFIAAWSRLDAAELASFFSADGVYHNMPARPVAGQAAVQAFIAGFIKDWTATEWDIVNIVETGDLVIAERLDRTLVGDRPVDLPCCGVFEMSDGKIKVWRDYFDLSTYTRALGA
jgi:limonene-1,2-epoxide hydrolase